MLKNQIQTLSDEGIHLLVEDCTYRIGSNTAGGNPDPNYIKQQEAIIEACQNEMIRRREVRNLVEA